MKTIKDIRQSVTALPPLVIAVAGISEEEILLVRQARDEGLAEFILIDEEKHIQSLLEKYQLAADDIKIAAVPNAHHAPAEAVRLVSQGEADLPMKGQVHTSTFLKAVLDREKGLASGKRLSQITMFDGYQEEPQFLTDCAINIAPALEEKIEIIENAAAIFSCFSEEVPYVALLGAVETVSPKMPDTIDSAVITQMNRRGQITGCVIDGPLSLDNAISKHFAAIKKIDSPVAGKAQILVSSDLREANNVSKAIIHYAKRDACSIIAGTTIPVVMTSRTDRQENKINTIAVACYMFHQMKRRKEKDSGI